MEAKLDTKLLGDVATLQRGFDLPYRLRKPGHVPVVTSSGFEGRHNVPRVKGPGVVTGRYGTIGRVFYIAEDFWPLNTTLYVKDFHGNDPLFISYLLRTIDFHTHSGKSGVPGVNRNDLHTLEVIVPGLPEQKRIATILADADRLTTSFHELIVKKRYIMHAMMQRLVTGDVRLPGFQGRWKDTVLGEEVHIRRGQLITEKTLLPGLIPVIAGGKKPAYFHSVANRKGTTITISASGANAGYVALFKEPIFASDCSTISESKSYCIEFIYYWLRMNQEKIYQSQTGGAQPHIHPSDLGPLAIDMPEVSEQEAIAKILVDMDREIETIEQRLAKIKSLKQGMMQNLLTGRIRLI